MAMSQTRHTDPRLLIVTNVAVFIAVLGLTGCSPAAPDPKIAGNTMGTTYSVRIAYCEPTSCNTLANAISARLTELNRKLSHYDPASELSLFNANNSTDWVPASPELAAIVDYALQVSEHSSGAFDITVAPAVNAWGFGPAHNDPAGTKEPDEQVIATALSQSGYRKLAYRGSPRSIRKQDPQLQLDLSAIAKGYAVDQLAYLIEAAGYSNYLIEIGGELRAAGTRPDGKPWRIGIESPLASLAIDYVVIPGNNAVATSGDYRNYYMVDDRRIAHTIDPASARPVENNLAAVSVIAPSAMQADAWATALMVMGPAAGPEFARQSNMAALFFVRAGATQRVIKSPAFAPYLLED